MFFLALSPPPLLQLVEAHLHSPVAFQKFPRWNPSLSLHILFPPDLKTDAICFITEQSKVSTQSGPPPVLLIPARDFVIDFCFCLTHKLQMQKVREGLTFHDP